MNHIFTNSLIATILISCLSLVGVIGFIIKDRILKSIALMLVAFSTGSLLGGAFFHLLPESIGDGENLNPFIYLLFGIIIFYILERFLKWHHCHENDNCAVHSFSYMSLFGDGLHNFIDGLVIVSAFSISIEIGVATSIAIASHEIPQEFGDFGILIHGGMKKTKAIFWNLLVSLSAIVGVIIGYFLLDSIENISLILLPIAAGGFIYISMSDLIPELHKEKSLKKSLIYFVMFVFGLSFMYLIKIIFE